MSTSEATILVVDDDETLSELLGIWLGRDGFTVRHARSMRDAVTMFDQQPAAAVITDYELGHGVTGLDLTRSLRVNCPDLPIVIMSGYRREQLSLDDAGVAFFQKPFDPSTLIEYLREAIDSAVMAK